MLKYGCGNHSHHAAIVNCAVGKEKDMTKTSKSKIAGMIAAIIVIAIIFAALTFGLVFKLLHYNFFSDASSDRQVPGLSDGLVQQGYDYVEDKNVYLASGYMKDGSASRVYVITGDSTKAISLYYTDGETEKEYTAHAGGIAHYGDFVYIADEEDDGDVAVFSLNDILGEDNKATCIGRIQTPDKFNSSFCTVYGDYLYVGSFAKKDHEKYGRVKDFEVTVGEETNSSLILAYKLDPTKDFSVDTSAPELALSIGDLVQGMCFAGDGRIILSTSWSLSSSHLYFYSIDLTAAADTSVKIGESDVPVYFLGEDELTLDLKAPPMAEEMVVVDGRVYIMSESASKKYIFGNFIGGRKLYSYPAGDEQFTK